MDKFVKLTKKRIKDIFQECNELYFDNKVETPTFFETWTSHKKCVGWVRAIWNKKTKSYVSALHISSLYNWTNENLKKVIIHEMIHLDIKDYLRPLTIWKRLFGKEHDKDFMKKMDELNEKYNLDITVRAKFMKQYKRQ